MEENLAFESFDQYCNQLNEDEKGVFGSLIDKTKTFIPRVMRYKRAKAVMKSYLKGFEKKSLSLIKHFEKNMTKLSKTIDDNYTTFKHKKIEPMMANDKIDQAVNLSMGFKKDLETLKNTEIKKINDYISKILDNYSAAIEKRIDTPGFILNVELSDRGKGSLKAKWSEISSVKKMEVEEKIMKLIDHAGLNRIDEISSELDSFIEEHKYSYGKNTIDFYISSVEQVAADQFRIEIFLRSPGHRHSLSEKGILLSDDPNKLVDAKHSKLIKMRNLYFSSYVININAKETDYIRPYLKLTKSVKPIYGDIEQLVDMVSNAPSTGAQQNFNNNSKKIPNFNPTPL